MHLAAAVKGKGGKYFRVILVFKLVSSVFSCSSVLSVNFF